MPPTLNLNCLVLGDGPDHIFPVNIASTESVGALKKSIKDQKKHAFKHVDADTLNIFKVSFPVDNDLVATLQHFQPEHVPENGVHRISNPVEQLEVVFDGPINKHLHVIILPPPSGEKREEEDRGRVSGLEKRSHFPPLSLVHSQYLLSNRF